MQRIEGRIFDEERALYGLSETLVNRCRFEGPADGESALKECHDLVVNDCFFNLRYPLWHNHHLKIDHSEMTELCRAALWYDDHVEISDSALHGIKALRECRDVDFRNCDVVSPEFGWSLRDARFDGVKAEGEYFLLRGENLVFRNFELKGKYSFQYIRNAEFDHCIFDTKDAFWHCENVTVKNSAVKGEYLGWYANHLTFENCRISGTQPLCYARNLRLINCEMTDADLAFEKSEVEAELTAPILSIKNPHRGKITVPSVGEIIMDDPGAKGVIEQVPR